MREIFVCASVMSASATTTASVTTTDSTTNCNRTGKYGPLLKQLSATTCYKHLDVIKITVR